MPTWEEGRMLGATLQRASGSRRLRTWVESSSLTSRVVERFIAGEDIDAAIAAAARLHEGGLLSSLDVLGESVTDTAMARAMRDRYLDLLHALDRTGAAASSEVSVKLSALGQALPHGGADLALLHAQEICAAAEAAGSRVTLDMEDHTTTEATLTVGQRLRAVFPSVGTVLQANLLRTPGDVAALADREARVRLVKGAYREPPGVALQQKGDVDRAYREALALLMHSSCYPMVATHDPAMIRQARHLAAQAGRGADDWEVQMLYGIGTDLRRELLTQGVRVRVYIPFGTDWFPYFMRRLAERPANVGFFLRALVRG